MLLSGTRSEEPTFACTCSLSSEPEVRERLTKNWHDGLRPGILPPVITCRPVALLATASNYRLCCMDLSKSLAVAALAGWPDILGVEGSAGLN
jgi:hypothetical protein